MKSTKSNIKKTICVIVFLLSVSGCKKLIEVDAPISSINSGNVYTSDATAIAAVTGIYVNLSKQFWTNYGAFTTLSLLPSLSADELTLYSGVTNQGLLDYYKNSLTNRENQDFWPGIYPFIYQANLAIESLQNNNRLTQAIQRQLLGEAKFIRALGYFYLVNLYGDVPLALSSDYKINSALPRTSKTLVYQQVIKDLVDAQATLNKSFPDATLLTTSQERVRPTYWAATALLSRTYLYYGNLTGDASNYANAETQATSIISNSGQFGLTSLDKTFLKASLGNNEAIWQLQPVNAGQNTQDALTFVLPSSGPNSGLQPVYLSNNLLSAFESGDGRRISWIKNVTVAGTTYYYANKYKANLANQPVTEYETILRLSEQYLIRAEARIQLSENSAVNDINVIRNRAGLGNYSGPTDKTSLSSAIMHERQVELFTEWGNRWLDMKRTGTVDAVMGTGGACAAKGGTWNTNQQLYPVPFGELQVNPFLKQNPGY
jgi:hypothetical protein